MGWEASVPLSELSGFGGPFCQHGLRRDFQQLVILATVCRAIGCREKITSECYSLTQFEFRVPVVQYPTIEGSIRRQHQTGTAAFPLDEKATLLISENTLGALESGLAGRSVSGARRAMAVKGVFVLHGVHRRLLSRTRCKADGECEAQNYLSTQSDPSA